MLIPKKRANEFYLTREWVALRAATKIRDGYRCELCGADVSGVGMSRVDHIKPRNTHPDLALDPYNVRTLCVSCDGKRHREKGGSHSSRFESRGCDVDGWPLHVQPLYPRYFRRRR